MRSYGAASKDLGHGDDGEMGCGLNDRVENSHLPFRRREHAILRFRLDWQLGEFTLSASQSKGTNTGGGDVEVDALGAIWRHEFDKTTLFVGAGYDKGPMDRFNSLSFGFNSGGLNVVINRIHRTPLVFNRAEPDFDTSYEGLSLSYDFGDVTLGVAQSSQRSNIGAVFTGKAKAWFASWQVREDIVMDFEFSDSDYLTGDDTRKASVAVAMKF